MEGRNSCGRFEVGNKIATGRTKDGAKTKDLRGISQVYIIDVFSKYLKSTASELKMAYKDESLPATEIAVIGILISAIQRNDHQKFEYLISRVIGKIPERVDHISSDGTMSPYRNFDLSKLTDSELDALEKIKTKLEND